MGLKFPIKDCFHDNGLGLIKFPVDAEYSTLIHILDNLNDQGKVLIHSKSIRNTTFSDNTVLIDATGHALTARTALRQKISASEDISSLDNPEDIQSVLNQLYKIRRAHPESNWWIWWSPSDLVAHDIDENGILRCLRAIAKEFSDVRFIAMVAKEVHSKQALARLEYIADVTLDIERLLEEGKGTHQWFVQKHPIMEKEGVRFIA